LILISCVVFFSPLPPISLHERKLHAVIDRAIADGRISKYEMEQIDRSIYADGKVLVEEITMVRQLVKDKINDGSLVYDWNN